MRRPPVVAAFLSTLILQVGALQTPSSVEYSTEPLSFSRIVDVLYSNDPSRQGAAHEEIRSLCATNGPWARTALKRCDQKRELRDGSGGSGEFTFALVLSARDNRSFGAFAQSFNAVRHFHPRSSIVVVDNASPLTQSQRVLDFLQNEPNTLYVRQDEGSAGFEVGGYSAALGAARKNHWQVGGWVFLQATAVLLQPLPLRSMPCKLMSFFQTSVWMYLPCGPPKFNQAEYEAFHKQEGSKSAEYQDTWTQLEFRRLKHEFPEWGHYEERVCGGHEHGIFSAPLHQFLIATAEGMEGLEQLGYFSIRPTIKQHSNIMEEFGGIFFEALDSGNTSCFIDKERTIGNQPKGAGTGTYIYKQHGAGWNQGFFAGLLDFINVVDKNKDMLVNGEEIAYAKANRPEQFDDALGKFCKVFAIADPFQGKYCDEQDFGITYRDAGAK